MASVVNGRVAFSRRKHEPSRVRADSPPSNGTRPAVTTVKKNYPPGTQLRRKFGMENEHPERRAGLALPNSSGGSGSAGQALPYILCDLPFDDEWIGRANPALRSRNRPLVGKV